MVEPRNTTNEHQTSGNLSSGPMRCLLPPTESECDAERLNGWFLRGEGWRRCDGVWGALLVTQKDHWTSTNHGTI